MAAETGDKVTRKYSNFRGVDFRGEECSLNRSPDALNVWRNYKKLSSIETRPRLKKIITWSKGLQGMRWHKDRLHDDKECLYFIDGEGRLIRWNGGNNFSELPKYNFRDSAFLFEFEGKLYVKGAYYFCVTDNELVEPYIPTTMIEGKPGGGGKPNQDVNMLTGKRYNTFYGDGKSRVFNLDAEKIDATFTPQIWIDGVEKYIGKVTIYTKATDIVGITDQVLINANNGAVMFPIDDNPPPAPATDGQDNITILYQKNNADSYAKIAGCTLATEFDNRVFFYGNPKYPGTMWHSSLDTCAYISDLDEYTDGADDSPIRSVVAGNNALWVFKGDSTANNSVFYHVPTPDAEYGKVYPRSHSSISLGCEGRAINFNDDIVFFSHRGMESASTDITTEQFATHKSSLVDRKMTSSTDYKNMILAEWEGYLLVFIKNESGTDVFLADSRTYVSNENHYEYEWFHWNIPRVHVSCVTVHDGVIYLAMEEGNFYTLTGNPEVGDELSGFFPDGEKWEDHMYINSYWTTPKDKFGAVNMLKTTNKKGCVVEALGDVAVYAKVEDSDFELIGENNDVKDYFTSRIKRKKFKDIQLKFQSHTGFSLEAASLECFIGGYIKR